MVPVLKTDLPADLGDIHRGQRGGSEVFGCQFRLPILAIGNQQTNPASAIVDTGDGRAEGFLLPCRPAVVDRHPATTIVPSHHLIRRQRLRQKRLIARRENGTLQVASPTTAKNAACCRRFFLLLRRNCCLGCTGSTWGHATTLNSWPPITARACRNRSRPVQFSAFQVAGCRDR